MHSLDKEKGIYLVTEKGCLNPSTGAFHHIDIGCTKLREHFKICTYLYTEKIGLDSIRQKLGKIKSQNSHSAGKTIKTKGPIYGTAKDIQVLILAVYNTIKLYRLFKAQKIDFVYERTSYLNFSGLIASKLAGIKHYYESNGIQFKGKQKYYRSYLQDLARHIEKWAYKKSDHVFFIGTYGFFWNLDSKNWTNIENGIEEKNITRKKPNLIGNSVDICFIGALMDHHMLSSIIEALNMLDSKLPVNFHLVGSGFDDIKVRTDSYKFSVHKHGFLERSELKNLISEFHIGVIAGTKQYSSYMKLFDYASGNCAVVAPETINFKYWFNNEICFFNGSPEDLANKIQSLIQDEKLRNNYSCALYDKVKDNFTWTKIYDDVAQTIKRNIKSDG